MSETKSGTESAVLGLIVARGGSKGLPGKNVRDLLGKPLVGWVSESAANSVRIDEVVISTDDDEIREAAVQHGARAPFVRPPELATDRALVIDVILHALDWLERNEHKRFKYVCLVQPTSPVTFAGDYDRAIDLAFLEDADTVISVYPVDHHPHFYFTLNERSEAGWLFGAPDGVMRRRQDLEPVYARAGNVYIFRTAFLRERNNLYGGRLHAVVVPRERAVTIDTEYNFAVAELQMKLSLGRRS